MAGWDEETLIMVSLVDEDTPDGNSNPKRPYEPMFNTPPTNARRKRRDQRKSPVSKFVVVLEESLEEKKELKIDGKVNANGKKFEKSNESSSGNTLIPCFDRLLEELSCAICLEICFEPSTTSCGHSFCKKCLRSAADKCGLRCPKCRQLISNGRSCTINTVLWNTIQLLFPEEIEARKVVAEGSKMIESASVVLLNSREAGDNSVSRRRQQRELPQDEDVALALRWQRDEFMGVLRGSVAEATGDMSAMTSRAVNIRRL